MHFLTRLVAVSLPAIALAATSADAAITVTFVESGANVIATTSGSLDLTGMTSNSTGGGIAGMNPSVGYFGTGVSGAVIYSGVNTGPFGTGGYASATTSIGDDFGIGAFSNTVSLPSGYVSGTSLSATTTFAGSFASLGLTAGVYSFSTPADVITFNIKRTIPSVPEPASWAMMIAGFAFVGAALRGRKRQQTSMRFAV